MKKERSVMKIILIGIYLCMTVAGLVLMKYGKNPGSIKVADGNISFGVSFISGIGLLCYIISFVLFTRIVIMFDLSYIYPVTTGIIQILSLLASKVVFKENITVQALIGASLVIIGIVVMNMPKLKA